MPEGDSQRGFPRILHVVFPVFYTWFSPYEIRGFSRIILQKGFSPLNCNLFLTIKQLIVWQKNLEGVLHSNLILEVRT